MSSVTLTSAMRNNLLSLRRLSLQMGKTQEILSTGKKVNSAIDNASNYYQARSLTNRAADLMELLNSMDQGIRTIEAATVGLEQGAAFLEQATAVATEALTTAKIPAKEWFEARQDVAAVVSDWNELKAALDRGITGNIVIYGQIECEDSITLKDGQNLVGVGYFGDFDTEVDKFSQLNFDLEALGIISGIVVEADSLTIADLTIKAKMRKSGSSQIINLVSNGHQLHNIDILMDNKDLKVYEPNATYGYSRAIMGGGFTMSGINNIADIPNSKGNIVSCGINTSNVVLQGQLNIQISAQLGRGIAYGSFQTVGAAGLNIVSGNRGIEGSSTLFTGNSQINILAGQGFVYGECTMTDNAKVNIKAASAFYATVEKDRNYPLTVNVTSTNVKINTSSLRLCQNNYQNLTFNVVAGSLFGYNGKIYRTETDVNDNKAHGEIMPNGFKEVAGAVASELPSLNWLQVQNQNRDMGWKQGKNQSSGQYEQIIKEYDTMVADSSYQGVNLLTGGKVDVTFNETRSHKFTVAGQDMSAQALGIATLDWQTQGDIAQSLSEIAAALNSIRGFQEELANHYGIIQTRQDFTEALADVLETGADDLVLADMNEASAEYLTLQTRQYLAVNALSLAAQSSRGILRLF